MRSLWSFWIVGVWLLLSACSGPNPVINQLTQAQPDAQRERAMRRLALAVGYFEQGQTEVAQHEARAALELDDHYAQAYNLLGLIHQRAASSPLAEQSYLQALRWATPSEHGEIAHNYGWFLCQEHRFLEAQIQFQQALNQPAYRQVSKTRLNQGLCQLRAGEPGQARGSFEAALAADPHNAMARVQLDALTNK